MNAVTRKWAKQSGGPSGDECQNLVTAFHATQDPIHHHHTPAMNGEPTGAIGVSHGVGVRRLTPRECERLQGLPDDWTRLDDSTADSRRYSALGDAVTATVAQWIGERIRRHA